MIKKLYGCIGEYKKPTIVSLLLIVLEAIIETFIPFITADLVNRVKAGADIGEILETGAVLFVMAAFSLMSGGGAGIASARASAGFAKNLRAEMFSRIGAYSFGNIDKFSTSSLVTRVTTDVQNVQMSYMIVIRTAIRAPLMLIFSVVMAYIMGGALATAFVVLIPVLLFGLITIARFAMPAFRRVFRKYDRLNESIEENVRAMRVVKGFAREEHEKQRFTAAAEDIRRDFTRAERIVALNAPLMQICLYANMIFVLLIGSRMAIESRGTAIDVGQLSAMLTYGFQILMSLMMFSMIYVMLTMSGESLKRIGEILDETPTIVSPENPVTEVKDGSIVFRGVSFSYAEGGARAALSEIDLEIASGMTVGILGGTGSGKTTLVQMIPRLYDATEGEVLVGGENVRRYDLSALRHAVGMVLQKNQLFSGTIAENLRWGAADATDEELREACRLAEADGFVSSFPDGYETRIEQGGTNVSGGQKQRLCIARALLMKPKVLIFDDSTSAVDTRTDAAIRRSLSTYLPETTKLIIAQRVASVQEADLILLLEDGRIAARGTHEELLASSEHYRELCEQQMGGDENE